MLKNLYSTSLVPNGYVYTSHTGSKYIFLEGLWFNNSSMKMINPEKYVNMYSSAQKQIFEHNTKSNMKIGQKYLKEGKEYVYLGESTLNEADQQEFSNFVNGKSKDLEIPDKFQLGTGADAIRYSKSAKKWIQDGKIIDDARYNKELNTDAVKKIKEYNADDSEIPVNSTVDYRGQTLTWNGVGWVNPEGKQSGDKFNSKFNDFVQDNPSFMKSTDNTSTNANTAGNNSSNSSLNSVMKKGQHITDPHGKVYVYDGNGKFISSDGKVFPEDKTRTILQNYTDHLAGKNKDTESNSASTDQNTDNASSEQNTGTQSSVPNGYVYTSGKQKKYLKKNGQWISLETKKPVSSSSAIPLERAAVQSIEKFNATSPIKIGTEFKSKKGQTYSYLGGERFMSADGKLLPQNTAQQFLSRLNQQSSDENQVDNSDEQETNSPDVAPEQSPSTSSPAPLNTSSQSNDGSDPMQALANEIKSNPEARRIVVLLSRGDDLSLLAADILLSGKQKEVAQIIKSLNTTD